ncbi:MAG TPA: hypothetical protein VFE37_25840 [Chloroflexota bacterium]|nr:hypothetical protein [Chloroflexota bacterium]
MSSRLDVDELLPPSESLVALQFETLEEFQRCRALLWEHPDCFQWLDQRSLVILVRRADLPVLASAELQYRERPVVDGGPSLSDEDAEGFRRWMRDMNARMLRGLSLDQ